MRLWLNADMIAASTATIGSHSRLWGLWGLHEAGKERQAAYGKELLFACRGKDRSAKTLADDRLSRTVVTKGCRRPPV